MPKLLENYRKILEYLVHFLNISSKSKKNPPPKKFPVFWKMELFSCIIKKFLVFSQKKDVLTLRKTKTGKKIFIFQET